MKKMFLILLAVMLPLYVYAQITSVEIHDDYGPYNQWPSQRIGITSGNAIWVLYDSNSSDRIKAAYSYDSGQNWTLENVGSETSIRNPSIFIDVNTIHASYSNSGETDMPRYIYRNGAWGDYEEVTDLPTGPSYPQVAVDANDVIFCCFLVSGDPYGNTNTGGSWGDEDQRTIDANYTAKSLSCCMDESNNMHCAWYAEDEVGNFKFQTAYYNGTDWSSVTTFETVTASDYYTDPTINYIGNTLIVMWARYGVGTYTDKRQLRYSLSTELGSWSAAASATDEDFEHIRPDCCGGSGSSIYCVYSGYIDPNNTSTYNLASIYYNGSWSASEILTYGNTNKLSVSTANTGATIHITYYDTGEDKQYYGTFGAPGDSVPQMIMIRNE